METTSTEVTSIRRRNNIEKSRQRTHWYIVDFESRFHVEISTSNQCHNFHVDSPFRFDEISVNFPRGISTKICPKMLEFLVFRVYLKIRFFLKFSCEIGKKFLHQCVLNFKKLLMLSKLMWMMHFINVYYLNFIFLHD